MPNRQPPAAPPPIALVPAAGSSRRMGRPKLHLPFAGTTILAATIEALRQGGASPIVVVVGPEDTATPAWAAGRGLRLAVNPRPQDGMLSSIVTGLASLGGGHAVAASGRPLLVCPADLPRLRAETVATLIRRAVERPGIGLAHPVHAGRRGHPLWIAAHRVAEIATLDPALGLRALRDRHPDEVLALDCDDPGTVLDIDTEADYRAAGGG